MCNLKALVSVGDRCYLTIHCCFSSLLSIQEAAKELSKEIVDGVADSLVSY